MFSVFSGDSHLMNFNSLRPLLRELDEMIDQRTSNRIETDNWRTNLNLSYELDETDAHYVMSFDIPGVRREDLNIELDGNYLRVSGERKFESQKNLKSHGKFQRSFMLPEGVLPESIVAEHKDGVLRVAIEKPTTVKKTKINITDGSSVNRAGGFFKNLIGEKKGKESELKGAHTKSETISLTN